MNSAPILAIQLCCFSNRGGQLVKDETLVRCTQSENEKKKFQFSVRGSQLTAIFFSQ